MDTTFDLVSERASDDESLTSKVLSMHSLKSKLKFQFLVKANALIYVAISETDSDSFLNKQLE